MDFSEFGSQFFRGKAIPDFPACDMESLSKRAADKCPFPEDRMAK
jgi:hypothetical protein